MSRVHATIQARMGSTRLPGKMMRPLCGTPLLGLLLDRLTLCRRLDGIVVATSERSENDIIVRFCEGRGIRCFRGSEDDVLGRMVGAAQSVDAEILVEVFGDGPLIDPALVDALIDRFQAASGSLDFVGNDLRTTYPPGMEVEVFTRAALIDSSGRTDDPAIREHGTLFIRQHPDLYRILNVEAPPGLRRPEFSFEVDTEVDFDVVAAVFEGFGGRRDFTLAELIAYFDAHPDLARRASDVPRRWKQYRPGDGDG